MSLAFVVLSMAVAGHAASEWLWRLHARLQGRPDHAAGFERATSAALVGMAIWIGSNWLLSPFHAIAGLPLFVVATLAMIGGGVALVRSHRRQQPGAAPRTLDPRTTLLVAAALAPVAAWIGFVLWRGWLLPVLNHDALSYHMPKAVLLMRARSYQFFDAPDVRIGISPGNYELLLSNVLILQGSDAITEWIGTLSYGLFLLGTAALVERWWGRGLGVLAAVLLVAGAPVLLLHSGAHKNDLLAGFFFLTTVLWVGRWAGSGGVAPAALAIVSLALALGTKVHALFLVAAVALVAAAVCVAHIRRGLPLRPRWIALALVGGCAAFFLLGGEVYLLNLANRGSVTGATTMTETLSANSATVTGYGDWANLWMFPYLLLTAPFSRQPLMVWVPWRHQYWYWPRYELYFSHYGLAITIAVLLLPIGLWKLRRWNATPELKRERLAGSMVALLAFASILPIRFRPLGFFGSFPRYVGFIVPVIAAWSVGAWTNSWMRGDRARRVAAVGVVLALSAVFSAHAVSYAVNDAFAPMSYVQFVVDHPGWRVPFFQPVRAASIADDMAGPTEPIAIDGALDTWAYPAFGRALQRPVHWLVGADRTSIPKDVDWVVIDRSFNMIWGNPDFHDMGQFTQLIGHGTPTADDLRLFNQLKNDPAFKLVFHNPYVNQAVFRRIR